MTTSAKKSHKVAWWVLATVGVLLVAMGIMIGPMLYDHFAYELVTERGWPGEAPRAWCMVYRHRWDDHEQVRLLDASRRELYRTDAIRLRGRGFNRDSDDVIIVSFRQWDATELIWRFYPNGEMLPPPNIDHVGPLPD